MSKPYGPTEIKAHDAALNRAAELFVERERRERAATDALDVELSHEPLEPAFDDEMFMSAEASDRYNAERAA